MGDGYTWQEVNRPELGVSPPKIDETDQAQLTNAWFGRHPGMPDDEKLQHTFDTINRILEARHTTNLNRIVWHAGDPCGDEPRWVEEIKQDGGHFLAICPDCSRDFIPTREAYQGRNFMGAPLYQHWGYESYRGWTECHRPAILETLWAVRGAAKKLDKWHPAFIKNRHTGLWRKIDNTNLATDGRDTNG